jgi:hypothetical protein
LIPPNHIYIGAINKINGFNRITFSITLNDIIESIDNLETINNELQNGVVVNFDNMELQHSIILEIINKMFQHLQVSQLYNDWMDDYTSISLYLLYSGSEVV